MKTTLIITIRLFVLGCVIPTIMSLVVYQGFSTNYTSRVFSEQSFNRQYEQGIYKYRVLGRALMIKVYQYIKYHELPTVAPTSLKLIDRHGDRQFYSAYLYMNTFFLCLTCLVLFFVLGGHTAKADFLTVDIPLLFLFFLMAMTEYVVSPYDILSYFFLSVAALFILHHDQSLWNTLALCVVVVLGTLTRETISLVLVFYLSLNYKAIMTKPVHLKLNREQGILLLLTFCFFSTYLALRDILGYEHAFYQKLTFLADFDIFSIAGTTFLLSIFLLVFLTGVITKEMQVFLIAALPYIAVTLLAGSPWEIRLWVPPILLLLIMKMKTVRDALLYKGDLKTMPLGEKGDL